MDDLSDQIEQRQKEEGAAGAQELGRQIKARQYTDFISEATDRSTSPEVLKASPALTQRPAEAPDFRDSGLGQTMGLDTESREMARRTVQGTAGTLISGATGQAAQRGPMFQGGDAEIKQHAADMAADFKKRLIEKFPETADQADATAAAYQQHVEEQTRSAILGQHVAEHGKEDFGRYAAERTPFVGTLGSLGRSAGTYFAAKAIKEGTATADDYALIGSHLADAAREGGKSGWRKAADIATSLPGFVAEWIATGGASAATKKAVAEHLGTSLAARAVGMTAAGAARTAVNVPRLAEGTLERMTPEVGVGDRGQITVGEGKGAAKALGETALSQTVSNAIFEAGGPFAKQVGTPYIHRLTNALAAVQGDKAAQYQLNKWGLGGRTTGSIADELLSGDPKRRQQAITDTIAETAVFAAFEFGMHKLDGPARENYQKEVLAAQQSHREAMAKGENPVLQIPAPPNMMQGADGRWHEVQDAEYEKAREVIGQANQKLALDHKEGRQPQRGEPPLLEGPKAPDMTPDQLEAWTRENRPDLFPRDPNKPVVPPERPQPKLLGGPPSEPKRLGGPPASQADLEGWARQHRPDLAGGLRRLGYHGDRLTEPPTPEAQVPLPEGVHNENHPATQAFLDTFGSGQTEGGERGSPRRVVSTLGEGPHALEVEISDGSQPHTVRFDYGWKDHNRTGKLEGEYTRPLVRKLNELVGRLKESGQAIEYTAVGGRENAYKRIMEKNGFELVSAPKIGGNGLWTWKPKEPVAAPEIPAAAQEAPASPPAEQPANPTAEAPPTPPAQAAAVPDSLARMRQGQEVLKGSLKPRPAPLSPVRPAEPLVEPVGPGPRPDSQVMKDAGLTAVEKHVLEQRRAASPTTHEEIGQSDAFKKLNGRSVSRERVRQIEARALDKLGEEKSVTAAAKEGKAAEASKYIENGKGTLPTELHADPAEVAPVMHERADLHLDAAELIDRLTDVYLKEKENGPISAEREQEFTDAILAASRRASSGARPEGAETARLLGEPAERPGEAPVRRGVEQGGAEGNPDGTPANPPPATVGAAEGQRQTPVASPERGQAGDNKLTFKTAKGSTYQVHEDGTTTRNKAERDTPGHEGDKGKKKRSVKTVYVPAAVASALSDAGIAGSSRSGRVVLKDGKASLVTWNDKEGRWGVSPSSRDITFSDKPELGLSPLELWQPTNDFPGHESYKGKHAGNAITEITPERGAPGDNKLTGYQKTAAKMADREARLASLGLTEEQAASLGKMEWATLNSRRTTPFVKAELIAKAKGEKTVAQFIQGEARGKGLSESYFGKEAVKAWIENGVPKDFFTKDGGGPDEIAQKMDGDGMLPHDPSRSAVDRMMEALVAHSVVEEGSKAEQTLKSAEQEYQERNYREQLQRANPSWSEAEIDREVTRLFQEGEEGHVDESPIGEAPSGTEGEAAKSDETAEDASLNDNVRKFLEDESGALNMTRMKEIYDQVKEWVGGKIGPINDAIKRLLAPSARGPEAAKMAGSLRENLAILRRKKEVARVALATANDFFDKRIVRQPDPAMRQAMFLRIMDAIEGGNIASLPQSVRGFADLMRDQFDERTQQLLGRGILKGFIDNWFGHLWVDPNKAMNPDDIGPAIQGRKPMSGSESFKRQRVLPTWRDGIDAGFEPQSWNPAELAASLLQQMDKSIFGHDVFEEAKATGQATYVKLGDRPPPGWKTLDDKTLKRFAPKSVSPVGQTLLGKWYMPEQAATLLANYMDPGLAGNPIFDAIRGIGNTMNQFSLGLSAFHATAEVMNSIMSGMAQGLQEISQGRENPKLILKGLARTALSPLSPVQHWIEGSKVLKEYYEPGSQGAETAALVDNLQKGGYNARMTEDWGGDGMKKFRDTLRDVRSGKLGQIPKLLLRAIPALSDALSYPIMQQLVPRLKSGAAATMARAEMERLGPTATTMQRRNALGKIWDSIENRFGQLTYDNLFWARSFKDTMMTLFRAVGWKHGTERELGGAVADVPSSMKGIVTGEGISPRLAYALALPAVAAFFGSIYQYLMTGSGPDDDRDLMAPRTGGTNKDGTPERIQLPTYMKDVQSYTNRADEGPLRLGMNAVSVTKGKLHPLLTSMIDLMNDKDFFGKAIFDPRDKGMKPYADAAKHILGGFEPMSIANLHKQGADVSASKGVQSFFGLTPAPSHVTHTGDQQRAAEDARKIELTPLEKKRKEEDPVPAKIGARGRKR